MDTQKVCEKEKTAIMGFGNPCRNDDAVGVYVINELEKKITNQENLTIFDMGTSAFELLFNLRGHSKIILIDAVINTGEEVGTLYKLPASEIESSIIDDPLVFLHGLKWDQALSYAKKIMGNEFPNDIIVYLIAINDTKLEATMSEEVKTAGDKLISIILNDELLFNNK